MEAARIVGTTSASAQNANNARFSRPKPEAGWRPRRPARRGRRRAPVRRCATLDSSARAPRTRDPNERRRWRRPHLPCRRRHRHAPYLPRHERKRTDAALPRRQFTAGSGRLTRGCRRAPLWCRGAAIALRPTRPVRMERTRSLAGAGRPAPVRPRPSAGAVGRDCDHYRGETGRVARGRHRHVDVGARGRNRDDHQ